MELVSREIERICNLRSWFDNRNPWSRKTSLLEKTAMHGVNQVGRFQILDTAHLMRKLFSKSYKIASLGYVAVLPVIPKRSLVNSCTSGELQSRTSAFLTISLPRRETSSPLMRRSLIIPRKTLDVYSARIEKWKLFNLALRGLDTHNFLLFLIMNKRLMFLMTRKVLFMSMTNRKNYGKYSKIMYLC